LASNTPSRFRSTRCTGCKACVSACHSLNGLDDDEVWRDVGTLLGGKSAPGWQQTITTACHHCEDPGCLNGCPVGAYEKDADTGIVRHLDDQCIGCSYCILKCPYDVPKYSKKRGIVRKCDMCHQRLAEGEAPACVQACPTEAIRIVKVTQEQLSPRLFQADIEHSHSALPSSDITRPTTRYVGREVPTTSFPADQTALLPQHAHWPLVLMLVFTQVGIGLLLGSQSTAVTLLGSAIFYAGMVASVFHLGQPLKAWRFFLGLRTSWLSREILAFSLFSPLPFLLSSLPLLPDFPFKSLAASLAGLSILPLGLLAVFTSVMIYHDTHRALWRFPLGACRFFGTVASFIALAQLIATPADHFIQALFAASILFKLSPELRILRLASAKNTPWTADLHSARLQLGPLRKILYFRLILASLGLCIGLLQPWLALPLLVLAEILERQLFFQSVHAPKMPGNFGPPHPHG
jgi:formate dehydrogenase iron-sulfur subunit